MELRERNVANAHYSAVDVRARERSDSEDSHKEKHFLSSEVVRDCVLGMSDGLTVPFALAAGLAGSVASSSLVVTAGLAEVAAGALSMGLGGYLAARSEIDHYNNERRRELRETEEVPLKEEEETREILKEQGVPPEHLDTVVGGIKADQQRWVDFMMKFELGLDKPDADRAWMSALVISLSYALGGIVPLIPYMVIAQVETGLFISIAVTCIALFLFGMVKGHFTGMPLAKSGLQASFIGALAAGAAYGMARAVSQWHE
eukprot:GILK01001809.1.p1 GENE.GILK01001809.1~~GILK01001809.1.p1  ORF type:complete len:260 (-),score=31.84 GILK01001809.1:121-900(-)